MASSLELDAASLSALLRAFVPQVPCSIGGEDLIYRDQTRGLQVQLERAELAGTVSWQSLQANLQSVRWQQGRLIIDFTFAANPRGR
ncbi:MAG: hypothetical protein RMM29_08885 [Planctomycetota bacterium]|nr:hypothetical protein [Planctomycetota bacterium]MCX8040365.1 hypothetical protein [Planctomycetota bacterium]MDW8373741.1 hypothetical protein [Planctomycetota bacterium]